MKPDQRVLDRFKQLDQKRQAVWQTRRRGEDGEGIDDELAHAWAISAMNLINGIFGESSVHSVMLKRHYDKFYGWSYEFTPMAAAFIAAKEDYEGGHLYNTRSLISAELMGTVLEQAQELLDASYKDAACVVAGVSLETALKELCDRNSIPPGKMDKMNADLCKAGVYNMGVQKQVTAWAHRRNDAAHGDWSKYTPEDVKDMIQGIERFIATCI